MNRCSTCTWLKVRSWGSLSCTDPLREAPRILDWNPDFFSCGSYSNQPLWDPCRASEIAVAGVLDPRPHVQPKRKPIPVRPEHTMTEGDPVDGEFLEGHEKKAALREWLDSLKKPAHAVAGPGDKLRESIQEAADLL